MYVEVVFRVLFTFTQYIFNIIISTFYSLHFQKKGSLLFFLPSILISFLLPPFLPSPFPSFCPSSLSYFLPYFFRSTLPSNFPPFFPSFLPSFLPSFFFLFLPPYLRRIEYLYFIKSPKVYR